MYVSFIASYFTVKISINNDELDFKYKFERRLEHLVSKELYPLNHLGGFEDNGDAHLKRTIMGREVTIAITNNEADSGPWGTDLLL